MKDNIKRIIKRVKLFEYVKGIKKEREDSPKSKSPSKVADAGTSGGDRETKKGKCPYISTIMGGAPQSNLSFKGTIKRNISNMLVIHKKDGGASMKTSDRLILELRDSYKVGETLMNSFPW